MIGLAVAYAGLLVSVATLLWRVWRLEYRAKDIEDNAKWLRECVAARAHQSSLLALSERVAGDLDAVKQLARALGYEWKRTDAKEGWEKKSILTNADIAEALKAIPPYPSFGSFGCIASGTGLFKAGYADRRKADRRKPSRDQVADRFKFDVDMAKRSAKEALGKKKPRRAH